MPTDYFRKAKSLYSSTSNSFGTGEGETITPASVTGLPTDTEMVLTFDKDVPGKLERILGKISGGNFVISSGGRGYDNTTEQSHTSPVVEYIWNASDVNDRVTAFVAEHSAAGAHGATILKTSGAQTITGAKTFTTGLLKAVDIVSTSATIAFPTSAVTVTLPAATDTLVGKATTDTLTNKRITKRVTTITSNANPTVNTDNCDVVTITAQAAAIASMTTNLSGTPTNFQTLIYRIKDDGTARAITWGASFVAKGTALPTTTVLGKLLTVGFIYDTVAGTWGCVASQQEA
jgi:hypothetical protein